MHWCCGGRELWTVGAEGGREGGTCGAGLDVSFDEFVGRGVEADLAGAVDRGVGDDGLGVDAREGLGGVFGEDGLFGHGW